MRFTSCLMCLKSILIYSLPVHHFMLGAFESVISTEFLSFWNLLIVLPSNVR